MSTVKTTVQLYEDIVSSTYAAVEAGYVTYADLLLGIFTGGTTHTRPIADTLVLADSFTRVMAYGRTAGRRARLLDSTRDAQGIRLGDVVLLVDQLARLATRVRTFADAVALTDATTPQHSQASSSGRRDRAHRPARQGGSESTGTRRQRRSRRPVHKGHDQGETQADSVVLADARRIAQGQALADAVALSDQLTRIAPRIRTFADTVLLSDAVLTSKTGAGQLNPADLIQIADSFTRLATYGRTITDPVPLTDARSLGRGRRVTDTIALTDQLTRTAIRVRTIADAIAVTDVVVTSFAGAQTRLITDLLAIADTFARAATWHRTFADTIGLTDVVLPSKVAARTASIADLVALADTLTRVAVRNRLFADVLALYDSIGIEGGVRSIRILNNADDIRWGEVQADVVLVGVDEVWRPE